MEDVKGRIPRAEEATYWLEEEKPGSNVIH